MDDLSSGEVQPGQERIAFFDYDDDGENSGELDQERTKFARKAGDRAYMRVLDFEGNSNLIKRHDGSNSSPTSAPEFDFDGGDDYLTSGAVSRLEWADIAVSGLIGVGGFACVCKVRVPKFEEDEDDFDDDFDGRFESKSHASSEGGTNSASGSGRDGRQYYALKCLNERTVSNEETFISGACDLASEALMLSHLRHENIVRLYGVTNGCVSEAFSKPGGYFLLLEFLRGTVGDLLRLWREDLKDPAKSSKIPSEHERLSGIVLGIANGMEYLHQNNVLLRDLKPSNIGFAANGAVKIFDFGLAREVPSSGEPVVPGVAGSYRYMAPEVALGRGSSYPSDVLSFGTVCWEVITLQKAYEEIVGTEEFVQKVARQGYRPSCKLMESAPLKALVKDCWNGDPDVRPTFTNVCKTLESEIQRQQKKEEEDKNSRHSWKKQARTLRSRVQRQWMDYKIKQARRASAT